MAIEKTIFLKEKPIKVEASLSSGVVGAKGVKPAARWNIFLWAILVITIGFSLPLFHLAKYAWSTELYSYILLMPFITWYLVRLKRTENLADSQPSRGAGVMFALAGCGLLAYYFCVHASGGEFEVEDGLAVTTLSFILCFFGAALFFLGKETMRSLAFPFGLMIFMVPMPVMMREGIETFLQYGSAYCAHAMFWLAGTPLVREGLLFHLPVLPLQVAPECSGIHSTFILFITSLLAGYLFLRSPWKRTILALVVVPLGLLRNGFRVFTIGQLCIHYGPQMIDSVIHRKGGPLFFAVSLIPFFALLAFLYKRERDVPKTVKA